jgi:hypothetical protein
MSQLTSKNEPASAAQGYWLNCCLSKNDWLSHSKGPLNILPLALKLYPCQFLHFLDNFGLFFSCNNADATTSAWGMPGSAVTEKHVGSHGVK